MTDHAHAQNTPDRCPICHCWYASSGYRNVWPCTKDCDCHYEAA